VRPSSLLAFFLSDVAGTEPAVEALRDRPRATSRDKPAVRASAPAMVAAPTSTEEAPAKMVQRALPSPSPKSILKGHGGRAVAGARAPLLHAHAPSARAWASAAAALP
jgi:hypothetical protein